MCLKLKHLGERNEMPMIRRDIIGMKVNKLTAIKRLERPDKKNSYWEFSCECGNKTTGILGNFLKGTWISCGCSNNPTGSSSKNWRGIGEIGASFVSKIKAQAVRRDIFFDIDIEYLWKVYESQGKQCAISGILLKFPSTSKGIHNGEGTASLDRINSDVGYIEGNVQWVHKDINMMKQQFDQSYFIDLCCEVYRRNYSV